MKRLLGSILIGTTAFAGGIVTALLLTPKNGTENRRWISEHGKETKDWLEGKSRKLKVDGEKRIDRLSKGIKKTVKDSLPDLYEATENLDFTEKEEIEEITTHG